MTCIAGVGPHGKVVIGGDSAEVGGYDPTVRADVKVVVNGPFIIGFTSSLRMGQLIEHAFKPLPVPKKPGALVQYMVVDFIDAVHAPLKDKGWV